MQGAYPTSSAPDLKKTDELDINEKNKSRTDIRYTYQLYLVTKLHLLASMYVTMEYGDIGTANLPYVIMYCHYIELTLSVFYVIKKDVL